MDTIESNKLIANFLGQIETISEFPQFGYMTSSGEFKTYFTHNELKFHKDWNWLMEVVEKIESLDGKKYYVVIKHTQCKFANYYTEETIVNVMHTHNKMQSVYLACLGFIKWYNQQNKVSNFEFDENGDNVIR